jgi:hypothetical protein
LGWNNGLKTSRSTARCSRWSAGVPPAGSARVLAAALRNKPSSPGGGGTHAWPAGEDASVPSCQVPAIRADSECVRRWRCKPQADAFALSLGGDAAGGRHTVDASPATELCCRSLPRNRKASTFVETIPNRRLAQLVEHHLHTVGVSGSSPLAPTKPLHSRRSGSQDRAAFFFPQHRRGICDSGLTVMSASQDTRGG